MNEKQPSTKSCPSSEKGPNLRRLSLLLLLICAATIAPTTVVLYFGHSKASLQKNRRGAKTPSDAATSNLLATPNNNRFLQSVQAQGETMVVNATNATQSNDCAGNPPVIDDGFCEANCTQEPESSWIDAVPLAAQIIMIIFLITMSALFSGLTLGLMGLDKTGLEIVMEGDDPVNAANAKRIYPLRKNGNLLLCTLLLGNVAVNSLLSILLADKTGGAVGVLSSTFLIVIFGEILPQALCSRYALSIGSATVPIVRVFVIICYPVAAPLAFGLDKALGDELVTTYNRAELLKLLSIHVQEGELDKDTADAMTGALKYKDMTVSEVMTPLQNTFMLSVDERLSFETIATIFKTGYSRIPIYEV